MTETDLHYRLLEQPEAPKDWYFAAHHLRIQIKKPPRRIWETDPRLSRDTRIGIMNFIPPSFEEPATTQNILLSMEGLNEFFKKIDDGKPAPEYLIGFTHRRMALFARKLGFTIKENSPGAYTVKAPTPTVRQSLDTLLAKKYPGDKSIMEVLRTRQARRLL